ncbi:MAG: hypothetical protein ABSE35_25790 [Bryobacteraceae bacterium]
MAKRRDAMTAGMALVAVLVVLALGFHRLGPRANQRTIKADERRVEDLRSIAQEMRIQNLRQMPIPASVAKLRQSTGTNLNDPVTNAPYEYHPMFGTAYELCATFATGSGAQDRWDMQPRWDFWNHPKGRYCYRLDASKVTEY